MFDARVYTGNMASESLHVLPCVNRLYVESRRKGEREAFKGKEGVSWDRQLCVDELRSWPGSSLWIESKNSEKTWPLRPSYGSSLKEEGDQEDPVAGACTHPGTRGMNSSKAFRHHPLT